MGSASMFGIAEALFGPPDGSLHPAMNNENAEVRRELLNMRTISDKRRQQIGEQ
jgi:hypothetical protein